MTQKSHPRSISHDASTIAHIRSDPEFAVEYLKVALEEATDELGRDVLRDAIRQIAQVYGIEKIAQAAGISPEAITRALASKGAPKFETLNAVVHAMGFQLTLEPLHH